MNKNLNRRQFFGWMSTRGAAIGLAGASLPALIAACTSDSGTRAASTTTSSTTSTTAPPVAVSDAEAQAAARPVVGDVIDFSLTGDGWQGDFGFVTVALRRGLFDGDEVLFLRTDASDESFARSEELVFVPKLAGLAGRGSGRMYVVDGDGDDQLPILSSEPGRDDYTPAWTLHRVRWDEEPQRLRGEEDVREAEEEGALTIEDTGIVVNAGIVKWSDGELPYDEELTSFFGDGVLIEPIDSRSDRATFKLNECYPGNRYIVLDHSLEGMAEGTNTVFSPGLHEVATRAGAVGRTNVFMNGLKGPGPMGFQPSAFDFTAGDPAWSPYWDHFTYAWKDGVEPRLLTSQEEVFAARDAGELDEFAGTPDAPIFTVNCPVLIEAPDSYSPPS